MFVLLSVTEAEVAEALAGDDDEEQDDDDITNTTTTTANTTTTTANTTTTTATELSVTQHEIYSSKAHVLISDSTKCCPLIVHGEPLTDRKSTFQAHAAVITTKHEV